MSKLGVNNAVTIKLIKLIMCAALCIGFGLIGIDTVSVLPSKRLTWHFTDVCCVHSRLSPGIAFRDSSS